MMDIITTESEPVNIDAMEPNELLQFIEANKNGSAKEKVLAHYAKNLYDAMKYRQIGQIQSALRLEQANDWLYRKLPKNLKW